MNLIAKYAHLIAYLSSLSVIFPLLVWIGRRANRGSQLLSLVGYFLLVSGFSDALSILVERMGKSNSIIYNFYSIISFILLTLICAKLIRHKIKLLFFLSAVYAAFVIFLIFYKGFFEFWDEAFPLQSVIFIVYSYLYFVDLSKNAITEKLLHHSPFLINTAIFSYFSINLYIFILVSYAFVYLPKSYGQALWIFHDINNIIQYTIFTLAMFYTGKRASPLLIK